MKKEKIAQRIKELCEQYKRENKQQKMKCAEDLYTEMKFLEENPQEEFWVIGVNAHLNIIYKEMIFKGTLTECLLDTQSIFRTAIIKNAVSIMLVHNHPSGNSNPSGEDIQITRKIKKIGDMLQIKLIEHLIIGKNNYTSLKTEGWLNDE